MAILADVLIALMALGLTALVIISIIEITENRRFFREAKEILEKVMNL